MRNQFRRAALAALATMATSSFAMAAQEIQWWHAMGGGNGERINKMAAAFNATQNKYKIVPVYKGNYTETMTAAVAAFRANRHPHIVQVFEVGTATMMAAKGAVYPIGDLMKDAGEPFDIKAYLPGVISYYQTSAGNLLSMPFNSSTPVLWYNQDAFDKAGIKEPPRTWPEMKSASEKLLAAGYKCGFSFGWQSWVMIENFNAWHNLAIGTKSNGFDGLDTELVFNNAATKRHLARLAEWSKNKLFVYAGRRGNSLPKFTTGECGMWLNSSAYYGAIKKQAKFKFGQAMLPFYPEVAKAPQNSIIGGATLWVLRRHSADSYKGVAKFMTYLSSPAVQAEWHQGTGYVPITTAAFELSKKQGFYQKNPGTDTAISQLRLNQPTANSRGLRFGNFVQIRDIINEEMENIWKGSKTADAALDSAVARGNQLLRKFQAANK